MAATSAGRLSSCARVMADSVAQAYLSSRIRLEQLRAAPVLAEQVLGQQRRGSGVRAQVRRVREIPLRLGSRMPENPAPVRGVVGRAEHLVKRPKARVADNRPEPAG